MRRSEIKRRAPVKRTNNKRRKAAFARAYGSKERAAWLATLPCANCGIVGYSEGAHIKNGGMSKKADARFVIPLCHSRSGAAGSTFWIEFGCHDRQHGIAGGWSALANLNTPEKREAAAARTEQLWLAHRSAGRTGATDEP